MTGTGGDLAEIGARGSEPGELSEPAGVALDGAGNVWVADRGNNRIQAFTPDGALLQRFGERGVGAGQFIEPTSVSVACNGLVTVADADNNRAQAFQFPPSTALLGAAGGQEPAGPDPLQPAAAAAARGHRAPDAHHRHPRDPPAAAADQLRPAGEDRDPGHAHAALGQAPAGRADDVLAAEPAGGPDGHLPAAAERRRRAHAAARARLAARAWWRRSGSWPRTPTAPTASSPSG